MVSIIDSHGGVVDKFMGDSVMAVFDSRDQPRAARQLLDCAIDIQLAMDEVNQHARRLGVPDIHMGIGINYGRMVLCELGSEIYRELTVLGDQVNLTARLTAFCLRGQILMSEKLHHMLNSESAGELFHDRRKECWLYAHRGPHSRLFEAGQAGPRKICRQPRVHLHVREHRCRHGPVCQSSGMK